MGGLDIKSNLKYLLGLGCLLSTYFSLANGTNDFSNLSDKRLDHFTKYYIDDCACLSVEEIQSKAFLHKDHLIFGFNPKALWFRLELDQITYVAESKFLIVGIERSFDFKFYQIDHEIRDIEVMKIGLDQVIPTASLDLSKPLYFTSSVKNFPINASIEMVSTQGELLLRLSERKIPYWISTVVLVLGFILVMGYYLISGERFYLIYSLAFVILFGYELFHAGVLKTYLSPSYILKVNLGINLLYVFVWLPLMYISRFSHRREDYIKFAKYSLLGILINLVFVYAGTPLIIAMVVVALEFIIVQFTLFILVIRKDIRVFDVSEKWFTIVYLFTLITPVLFALENFGVYPNVWAARYSFELVAVLEIVMWGIFMVISINRNNQQRLELENAYALLQNESKYAVIKGQETERNWFGKELHDNIGSTLSAVRLLIQTNPKASQAYLKAINEELIQLSSRYQDPLMTGETINRSIKRYISIINQSEKVNVTFEQNVYEIDHLPEVDKLHIFRVVQELISNAIRHGKSTKIVVQLLKSDLGHLIIYVEDNGVGFPDEYVEGLGLSNIRARLQHRLVDINIASQKGIGAQIEVVLSI